VLKSASTGLSSVHIFVVGSPVCDSHVLVSWCVSANDSQSLYGAQYATRVEVAPTNLTPNANFSTHGSVSYTTPTFSQINEMSARYATTNTSSVLIYKP
jgi:hypothetical protein